MSIQRFCWRLSDPPIDLVRMASGCARRTPSTALASSRGRPLEEPAAEKATTWSAWGHRKIWAMLRADGVTVSQSSVYRALKRRGFLLPARYHAERRAMAEARKKAFVSEPSRRNRVWQTDFTRLEISSGSAWWISPVTDYYAKVCLAAPVSVRIAARDAVSALRIAITNAEQLLGGACSKTAPTRRPGRSPR